MKGGWMWIWGRKESAVLLPPDTVRARFHFFWPGGKKQIKSTLVAWAEMDWAEQMDSKGHSEGILHMEAARERIVSPTQEILREGQLRAEVWTPKTAARLSCSPSPPKKKKGAGERLLLILISPHPKKEPLPAASLPNKSTGRVCSTENSCKTEPRRKKKRQKATW